MTGFSHHRNCQGCCEAVLWVSNQGQKQDANCCGVQIPAIQLINEMIFHSDILMWLCHNETKYETKEIMLTRLYFRSYINVKMFQKNQYTSRQQQV